MSTGGMAENIKPLRIGAEARGVGVDPCDRTANLIGDRQEVAAGRIDTGEIERGKVCAGSHNRFRRKSITLRLTQAPGAAMNEYANRRVRRLRGIEIKLLNRRAAVCETLRLAQAGAGRGAVRGIARNDLRQVGRVFDLG